jgi:SNF2 family DNA or RNA helicase
MSPVYTPKSGCTLGTATLTKDHYNIIMDLDASMETDFQEHLMKMSMDGKGGGFELTVVQMRVLMRDLLDASIQVNVDDELMDWYEEQRLSESEGVKKGTIDSDLMSTRLYPYQREGAMWLRQPRSVLLADCPGLGKTAAAIMALCNPMEPPKRILILAPKSVTGWWEQEIKAWQPQEWPTIRLQAPIPECALDEFSYGWVITNWETMYHSNILQSTTWTAVVGDECQKIKNRQTMLYKAVKRLRTGKFLLLTGTPLANNPTDLWTLLHLCDKSKFTSFWRFHEMFCEYNRWDPYHRPLGVRRADVLRDDLKNYMLRRTVEEAGLQLPPKTVQEFPLEMTPVQASLYKKMAADMYIEIDEGRLDVWNPLALMTRLRQLTSTTATLRASDHSAKLDFVMNEVENEGKLIVFSVFKTTIEALSKRLSKAEISHVVLTGDTSPQASEIVSRFQNDPSIRVLLGTVQTGGVGLTLTASSRIIFIDRHFNPTVQEQAEDRVYRIGQTKHVHILLPYHPKTIDERVNEIIAGKLKMTDEVLRPALVEHLREVME